MANYISRLFGKILPKKQTQNIVTPITQKAVDGSFVVDISGYSTNLLDFGYSYQNEVELVNTYRKMAEYSDVDNAIEEIVNEAIITDGGQLPVSINLDELDEYISPEIKEKIRTEFDNVLTLLNFKNECYNLFERFIVDGKLYFYVALNENASDGILEFRYIDPRKIRKIRIVNTTPNHSKEGDMVYLVEDVDEYFMYDEKGLSFFDLGRGTGSGTKIDPSSIVFVHSGKVDPHSQTIYSYLHKAMRPYNMLKLSEDSLVIYRMARAPERRVWKIDTGNLPPNEAESHMKSVMNTYKNKLSFNSETGDVSAQNLQLSMQEDIWLPLSADSQGTQIDTLSGGENLGELDDVIYFQKKLYKALGVPISRLESEKGFSLGRSTEITQEEVKFRKYIDKAQKQFSKLFSEALGKQLRLKNVCNGEEWEFLTSKISYDFLADSFFSELKEAEVMRERISLAEDAIRLGDSYYSKEYIAKHILKHTEEDIQEIQDENEDSFENDGEISTEEDDLEGIEQNDYESTMEEDETELQNIFDSVIIKPSKMKLRPMKSISVIDTNLSESINKYETEKLAKRKKKNGK